LSTALSNISDYSMMMLENGCWGTAEMYQMIVTVIIVYYIGKESMKKRDLIKAIALVVCGTDIVLLNLSSLINEILMLVICFVFLALLAVLGVVWLRTDKEKEVERKEADETLRTAFYCGYTILIVMSFLIRYAGK
jgi:hypothetical protein